jgi:hypothetical protein
MISRATTFQTVTDLTRGEFLAGLFTLGCANGLASQIIQSVNQAGWANALFDSFEISIVVWISCAAGIFLVLQDRSTGIRLPELAMGAAFASFTILPIGSLNWLAATALSLYVLVSTNVASTRRGALILLATTVPTFWSQLLFRFFANSILQIDASLVGWILGTRRTADIVPFADGSGFLVIMPGCSSLTNVSLAFLCWVTISQWVCHKASRYDLVWCLMACISMMAVNVMRISLMGLSQWHYGTLHGRLGNAVNDTIMFALMIGFCLLGVRRELSIRI